MSRLIVVFMSVFPFSTCLSAQAGPAGAGPDGQFRQLIAEQRWQEVVLELEPLQSRSADMNFYLATALARLERWAEAENILRAGSRVAPRDPRFPLELGGIAFKQKRYSQAARYLRRARHLHPNDPYTNDFLGTIYFLQNNLEAALKYWNRAGKPQVQQIQADPVPKVDPVLLDQAFAFAPASVLQLSEFEATKTRIDGLGIFPRFQLDLQARTDDSFDVLFRNQERDGIGASTLEKLALMVRGLPFLSVNPEIHNIRHEAANFVSLVRWDAQKRRVSAEFSSPFEHSAKYRYELTADLRNENWDIISSPSKAISTSASLNLRREVVGFSLASFASARLRWSVGTELSHRDFRSVVAGSTLTPQLLAQGYQLKQFAKLESTLWRAPEQRFTLDGAIASQIARLWSIPQETFAKLQGSGSWHWIPRAEGDDYEMRQRIRAGTIFGTMPFDELFMLGLERDNDLPLRAHIGTHNGRKGSAPLGREYFLSNWEVDKHIYGNGLLNFKLGPFLDTGKITDSSSTLGSPKWLWDTGVQAKVRVFGIGVVGSYGKDLRSGSNAFYLTMLK